MKIQVANIARDQDHCILLKMKVDRKLGLGHCCEDQWTGKPIVLVALSLE
jgi:hypothetical protein